MEYVLSEEYKRAKEEIIGNVEYSVHSTVSRGITVIQYNTEENGSFYEADECGYVKFWSDKNPAIRSYNPVDSSVNKPYGKWLAERIKTETEFGSRTEFQRFVVDRGFEFLTQAELEAAYDRAWKAQHDILISETEFLDEIKWQGNEAVRKVYSVLAGLVKENKLCPTRVFQYARFRWCLNNPSAIEAYEYAQGKWLVNNCEAEITEEEAKNRINAEWHFETDLIKIIGTAYYDATDWQFIRFNIENMAWLWSEGDLFQVYDD